MNTICDSLFYFHSITSLVSHYVDLGIDKGNVNRRSGSPDHRKTGDATTLGEWLKLNGSRERGRNRRRGWGQLRKGDEGKSIEEWQGKKRRREKKKSFIYVSKER